MFSTGPFEIKLATSKVMAPFRCWRVSTHNAPNWRNVANVYVWMRRVGGMCGAIVTSPFDVVKTRLQSDMFRAKHAGISIEGNGAAVVTVRRNLLWHFVETVHIIRYAQPPLPLPFPVHTPPER